MSEGLFSDVVAQMCFLSKLINLFIILYVCITCIYLIVNINGTKCPAFIDYRKDYSNLNI